MKTSKEILGRGIFGKLPASVRIAFLILASALTTASTQAAVIFSSSGGFLTSVEFTSDVVLNVSANVTIVNNNLGYNVVFNSLYSPDPVSSLTGNGTGLTLEVGGPSVTRNSISGGIGLLSDSVTPDDFRILFGGNGSGFTSIATGQQFTIKAGTFTFDSGVIPTPTNLGPNVSLFITPNGGGFGGGLGFNQISESVVVAVPEPSTSGFLLLGAGTAGFGMICRSRRSSRLAANR